MKKPILILGYERSGTTLLRRLVSMHPGMEYDLVHEQFNKLSKCSSLKEAQKVFFQPSKQGGILTGSHMSIMCGQKIPYINQNYIKVSLKKFNSFFKQFHVLHIVRHPLGSVNSQVKTFGKNAKKCINDWFSVCPQAAEDLDNIGAKTIYFEELMQLPHNQVRDIYDWIDDKNKAEDDYIEKVIGTKEPWDNGKRIMPGLRYFDSIQFRKNLVISDKHKADVLKRFHEIAADHKIYSHYLSKNYY